MEGRQWVKSDMWEEGQNFDIPWVSKFCLFIYGTRHSKGKRQSKYPFQPEWRKVKETQQERKQQAESESIKLKRYSKSMDLSR